jgi:hypothetical protein
LWVLITQLNADRDVQLRVLVPVAVCAAVVRAGLLLLLLVVAVMVTVTAIAAIVTVAAVWQCGVVQSVFS